MRVAVPWKRKSLSRKKIGKQRSSQGIKINEMAMVTRMA